MLSNDQVNWARETIDKLVSNVEMVIFGKTDEVRLVVEALVAEGNVLLEDVPGTGKTSLVAALARSIDVPFSRIQFTPDVMPSDISGFSILNPKTREFEFRPGSVMASFVLADEINRASAKTQSALLEAMEERQVTVDGTTYLLPRPFMLLATQNPIEQHGTYPLPEAQVDRFMIRMSLGYPSHAEEVKILQRPHMAREYVDAVVSANEVLELQEMAREVTASEELCEYVVRLVEATRSDPEVILGASPRGSLSTLALARARALARGRAYAKPDDVKAVAPYTLSHRLWMSSAARAKGHTDRKVIERLLSSVQVPLSVRWAR